MYNIIINEPHVGHVTSKELLVNPKVYIVGVQSHTA